MVINLYSNELYHYGIKGQKWGVRRYQNTDGSYTDAGLKRRYGHGRKDRRIGAYEWSPNYSEKQRMQDQRIYSRGAVKRINKRLKNGESIKGARSAEADRMERAANTARGVGNVARAVGGAGGAVAGYIAGKKLLKKLRLSPLESNIASFVTADLGYKTGKSLGNLGRSAVMLGYGYSPSKSRRVGGINKNKIGKYSQNFETQEDAEKFYKDQYYLHIFGNKKRYANPYGRAAISNRSIDLSNDYENTPKGSALRKNSNSAWDKLEKTSWDYDYDHPNYKKAEKSFISAEKKYLKSEGKTVAKDLIKEFGADRVIMDMEPRGWHSKIQKLNKGEYTENDLIKDYADYYYQIHRN